MTKYDKISKPNYTITKHGNKVKTVIKTYTFIIPDRWGGTSHEGKDIFVEVFCPSVDKLVADFNQVNVIGRTRVERVNTLTLTDNSGKSLLSLRSNEVQQLEVFKTSSLSKEEVQTLMVFLAKKINCVKVITNGRRNTSNLHELLACTQEVNKDMELQYQLDFGERYLLRNIYKFDNLMSITVPAVDRNGKARSQFLKSLRSLHNLRRLVRTSEVEISLDNVINVEYRTNPEVDKARVENNFNEIILEHFCHNSGIKHSVRVIDIFYFGFSSKNDKDKINECKYVLNEIRKQSTIITLRFECRYINDELWRKLIN